MPIIVLGRNPKLKMKQGERNAKKASLMRRFARKQVLYLMQGDEGAIIDWNSDLSIIVEAWGVERQKINGERWSVIALDFITDSANEIPGELLAELYARLHIAKPAMGTLPIFHQVYTGETECFKCGLSMPWETQRCAGDKPRLLQSVFHERGVKE